jgi:LDH2 family malate/lactate/ureidoglycolate dehydrogenase
MNQPPESFVHVQEDRLLTFATACFEKAGLDNNHAAIISRFLVNSDLRGVRSHGTQTVNGYCKGFENGHCNPRPDTQVIHETPTAVVVDGDGSLGYLPMARATEHAIHKAKEVGMGMGLVRHIGHYGSAGHYARMCSEAGCIGFSVQGGQHGKAKKDGRPRQLGYFGNPPICFAIPSGNEPPIVLDAATCILADYQRGPEFDALLEVIPAAFFKSIGYTAIASIIGGGLAGVSLPSAHDITEKWPGSRQGGTVIAIHVDSVIPSDIFQTESDRMVSDIRNTYEPMPGTDRALLPGAIEEERMKHHRAEGIRYGEMEQSNAREVSERLNVPLPWD